MAGLKNVVVAASLLTSLVAAAPLVNAPRDLLTHTHYETAWVTVEETATVWVDPSQVTPFAEVAIPVVTTTTTEAPVQSTPSTFATSTIPTPTATPVPVQIQAKSDASTSGTCEGDGAMCVGDVTHWDGGLGACGWTVDSNAENVIALPHGFMGTQSNGNPYCGRAVTLVNPTSGTTVQATVGDKCMGCEDRSIDCTNKLFAAITDGKGDGRMSGIQWYFSS